MNTTLRYKARIFLKAVLIVGGILLFLLVAMELTDRLVFRPHGIEERILRDFEAKRAHVRVLFLGQSDVGAAVIPSLIGPDVCNMAGSAESFIGTFYKLRYHIERMPELQAVVLPVSLASFPGNRKKELYSLTLRKYISRSDLPDLATLLGPRTTSLWLIAHFPIVDSRVMKQFFTNCGRLIRREPIELTPVVDGHPVVSTKSHRTIETNAKDKVKRFFKKCEPVDDDLLMYFEKTMVLCRSHGLKVIVITCPLSDAFIKSAEPYVTLEHLNKIVLETPRFSQYVSRYLNYATQYSDRHDLFRNSNHLNETGAEQFSLLIAPEFAEFLKTTNGLRRARASDCP